MEIEKNKGLSKWKKAKRQIERINDISGTVKKSINRYVSSDDEAKLETLDNAINELSKDDEKDESEFRFNITGNITTDIIRNLVKEKGRDIDPKEIRKIVDEYLGDKSSESIHFKFFKIPENDRLKYYQLLIKFSNFLLSEDKKQFPDIWDKIIQPIIDNGRIFDIEEEVTNILNSTDSKETGMPFDQIILNCRIPIKDRIYYGLVVSRCIFDDSGESGMFNISESDIRNQSKLFFSCYSKIDKNGERKCYREYFNTEKDKLNFFQKRLISFFYSFCNFLNEPEVEIIESSFNPKNNKRRKEKGSMALPSSKKIRIYGTLKKYIYEYSENLSNSINHRFRVRGHFRHLRDKERYSILYKLPKDKLIAKGYQISNDLIKKWVKPYTKGQGILIDKTYNLSKGGKK